jgi:hypothetical protein
MRLGWIALVIGLGTTALGGQALHEAKVAAERKDIAYAELVKEMPGLGWYKVSGARWSLIDAVTLRGLTNTTYPDVYVRVHAEGTPGGGDAPAKLLVHLRDQQLADYAAAVLARPSDERRPVVEEQKVMEEHPVEGTLESVVTIDHTDQKGVRDALGPRLADDYLVIAQGRKPNGSGRGIALLGAGLALLGLSALLLLRRGATQADELVEA